MRSADPAAYDQFVEITTNTTDNNKFSTGFRALMLTHSATAAVTFNVQQLVNGTLATAKTITVNTGGTGVAGTIILPLSGETVYVTSLTAGAKVYALI